MPNVTPANSSTLCKRQLSDISSNFVDIRKHGALSDGKAVYDATSTNSTTSTIGSVTAVFTSADVGKACAILPYTDTAVCRYGTITGFTNATTVTTSLNSSPGALVGATFVYGTDNLVAIDLALAEAASTNNATFIPAGLTLTTGAHIVPTGGILCGVGNLSSGGKAKDFMHLGGSSLIGVAFNNDKFIILGDTPSDPKGATLCNLNIDCMNLYVQSVYYNTRTTHIYNCTLIRGTNEVIVMSPTAQVHDCSIIGHNSFDVVALGGDGMLYNNIITGAGNGYYSVKGFNVDDIIIYGNHMWKDGSNNNLLGGQVLISQSNNALRGGVSIQGNKFDTSYGPHVRIQATGTAILRGISIQDNIGMQNDAVPDDTYPFIELIVDVGASIRGLSIEGNMGRGSWSDSSQGEYTYFIDGAGVLGNIYGSVIGGNVIDNCTNMYNSFTPDHDHGSITIAGVGTVLTKSTTT